MSVQFSPRYLAAIALADLLHHARASTSYLLFRLVVRYWAHILGSFISPVFCCCPCPCTLFLSLSLFLRPLCHSLTRSDSLTHSLTHSLPLSLCLSLSLSLSRSFFLFSASNACFRLVAFNFAIRAVFPSIRVASQQPNR